MQLTPSNDEHANDDDHHNDEMMKTILLYNIRKQNYDNHHHNNADQNHDNDDNVQEVEKRAETPVAPVAATPQSTRKDETVVDVQVMMMTMLL